jgi:hypothetical protein
MKKTPMCVTGLLAGLTLASAACGNVRTATRQDTPLGGRDATLVEVRTTGVEGGYRVVSFSSWDVELNETLPAEAPEDVVLSMRAAAATHGAEMLLIERWEDPWRKAFYGLGAVKADAAPTVPACTHAGFEGVFEGVKKQARTCADALKRERPAIRGTIEVVFEVDPWGRALRAAPTPASSRDSQLQACVVGPIHDAEWGTPESFTCKGTVSVDLNTTP